MKHELGLCPMCHGGGVYVLDDYEVCRYCGGTGRKNNTLLSLWYRVFDKLCAVVDRIMFEFERRYPE